MASSFSVTILGFPDSTVGKEAACNARDPFSICWRRDRLPTPVFLGFLCGSAGKESACKPGDLDSIPGLGRSPEEGKGYQLCIGLILFPADLPDPGIKLGSPALQVDSLPTELSGKPQVEQVVKNPPANAGDMRNSGLIPGSGRSPGEGNGYPLQYSGLENSMGSQRVRHD